MILALFIVPEIGLHAFWNVLIPVAPALLVISTGLWRNICPLGSTAMSSRHFNLSRRVHVTDQALAVLGLVGVVLLLALVPLRHFIFDLNGPSTALLLIALGFFAFSLGFVFDSKSAWCSGICPVHPVELLYGQFPIYSPANAHCGSCSHCVSRCAEALPDAQSRALRGKSLRRFAMLLMVGGFVGFIWGWFQVADYPFEAWGPEASAKLLSSYLWPIGGMAISLALYLTLKKSFPSDSGRLLERSFAAAAVACYYWYRLPALFGFGPHPGDGMLIDLTHSLPAWSVTISRVLTTLLFFYLLVGRRGRARSWTIRPPVSTQPRNSLSVESAQSTTRLPYSPNRNGVRN